MHLACYNFRFVNASPSSIFIEPPALMRIQALPRNLNPTKTSDGGGAYMPIPCWMARWRTHASATDTAGEPPVFVLLHGKNTTTHADLPPSMLIFCLTPIRCFSSSAHTAKGSCWRRRLKAFVLAFVRRARPPILLQARLLFYSSSNRP
jgi:hypothetical protein